MEEFKDVAKAKSSYKLYSEQLERGRTLYIKAGLAADPPPIPTFDTVFQKLNATARQELYEDLSALKEITPADAMRIWQSTVKRHLGRNAGTALDQRGR